MRAFRWDNDSKRLVRREIPLPARWLRRLHAQGRRAENDEVDAAATPTRCSSHGRGAGLA
ncbi:hypothetical protein [Pseudonocardia pini]|uniref:hypothetical protein n=1 Tax=Pseudonocardia pini TaxID=2758030 RepID=UPI0015F0D47E|nr:hypothetical protein [Pseudonocardia pini]